MFEETKTLEDSRIEFLLHCFDAKFSLDEKTRMIEIIDDHTKDKNEWEKYAVEVLKAFKMRQYGPQYSTEYQDLLHNKFEELGMSSSAQGDICKCMYNTNCVQREKIAEQLLLALNDGAIRLIREYEK